MSFLSSRRARRRMQETIGQATSPDPRKVMEQLVLENISRHMKVVNIIRSRQHFFTKGKSCMTNMTNFNDDDQLLCFYWL